MTIPQKEYAVKVLLNVAVPLLATVAALGAARQQLAGMEPRADHAIDIAGVRAEMSEQRIRDSARFDAMLTRVTDVACEQNPNRRYCR